MVKCEVGPHARRMPASPCAWSKREIALTVVDVRVTMRTMNVEIAISASSTGTPRIMSGSLSLPRSRTETFKLQAGSRVNEHKKKIYCD